MSRCSSNGFSSRSRFFAALQRFSRFRTARLALPLAILLMGGIFTVPAQAATTVGPLSFTGTTNFTPSPGISLSATVTWTYDDTAKTLSIDIKNQSGNAEIAGLFFNGPNGGAMTFSSASAQAPAVSFNESGASPTISGTGAPQQQTADGFGKFGYHLDFGSSQNDRLEESTEVVVQLTYAGTLGAGGLYSTSTGGGLGNFQAAIDWRPDTGATGFGGPGTIVTPMPEPATAVMAVAGLLPVGLLVIRKRLRRRASGL